LRELVDLSEIETDPILSRCVHGWRFIKQSTVLYRKGLLEGGLAECSRGTVVAVTWRLSPLESPAFQTEPTLLSRRFVAGPLKPVVDSTELTHSGVLAVQWVSFWSQRASLPWRIPFFGWYLT